MKDIHNLMLDIDLVSTKCIILGDFNMKSILSNIDDSNEELITHMKEKYNMDQYVTCATTESGSILDLCFSNHRNIDCIVTWNHWSDHRIVSAILDHT